MPHNSISVKLYDYEEMAHAMRFARQPCTKHCMFQSEMSFTSDESKVCGTVGSGMFRLDFSWSDHDPIVRAITGMFHTSSAAFEEVLQN